MSDILTTLRIGGSYETARHSIETLFRQAMGQPDVNENDPVPILIEGEEAIAAQLVKRDDGTFAINLTTKGE